MRVHSLMWKDGTYLNLYFDDLEERAFRDQDVDLETSYFVLRMRIEWIGRYAKRAGGRFFSVKLQYSGKTGRPYKNKARDSFVKLSKEAADRVDMWVFLNNKNLIKYGKYNPFEPPVLKLER